MEIGQRIHALRVENGLTLQELADKIGVSASTVHKWETGYIENVRADKIQKLAKALGVTGADIMGWVIEPDTPTFKDAGHVAKQIPILGRIACGEPILAEENLEGFALIDSRMHADFALRCAGDSMINARIFDGDIVFIRQQPDVENGEIAAVLIGNEATLKRVYKYPRRIELRPENPLFPVLQFEDEEMSSIQILGKAVAFLGAVK